MNYKKIALKIVHYAKLEISIIRLDIGFCKNIKCYRYLHPYNRKGRSLNQPSQSFSNN